MAIEMLRCSVTGNPCGTDTWTEGQPCGCPRCQAWLVLKQNTMRGFIDPLPPHCCTQEMTLVRSEPQPIADQIKRYWKCKKCGMIHNTFLDLWYDPPKHRDGAWIKS
jgi:hypothetical protein